jgi:hypothetical protein
MGGALKPKFFKPKTEIPNQVRVDKNKHQTHVVISNLGLMRIRLVSVSGYSQTCMLFLIQKH